MDAVVDVQSFIYRILAVIRAPPFWSAPLFQVISHYAIQCNLMGIYIRSLAHLPIFLRSKINKHCVYRRENIVYIQFNLNHRSFSRQCLWYKSKN